MINNVFCLLQVHQCLSLPSECRYVGACVSPSGSSVAAFSLYDNTIAVYLVIAGPTDSRLFFQLLMSVKRDGYVPQRIAFLEWYDWGTTPAGSGSNRYAAPEGSSLKVINSGTLIVSNLLDEAQRHSIDLIRVGRSDMGKRATGLTVERLDPFSCFVTMFGISRHAKQSSTPVLFFGDRNSNCVKFMHLKL